MTNTFSRRNFFKTALAAGAGLSALGSGSRIAHAITPPFPGRFSPTWDSLSQYNVPDWFRDAKLGVFMHWGVYSVPAHENEWYPRLMYRKENPVFEWHWQHWGPQSMFGYKDFIPMFRGENWKPDELVELYKKAGAKYIVPVGEHHDGFPMYDSHLTEWSAAKMGPCRDTIAGWAREVRNQGLKLGVSSHRAFHFSYYTFEKGYDTDNPLFAGLYGPIHAPTPLIDHHPGELVQQPSREFMQDWFARCVEIVDLYQPDLVYFDWANIAPGLEPYRKQFAAYYYNMAAERSQDVVVTYKNTAYPEHAAVLDIERGLAGATRELPWQTDTSVSWKSWGYIEGDTFKRPKELILEFVDIVSKNGNLLLNVGPKPDGTLPAEAEEVFRGIGRWMDVNGEAIYSTRPWKIYGEGATLLPSGSFGEEKLKDMTFTPQDMRFTTKGNVIYAILMAWPEREARIKALGKNSKNAPGRISNVGLLGGDARLKWRQDSDALVVEMPAEKPCDIAYALKIAT
ncbi:MAG TPA: alpha-L-fucosidase [Terriglobia bacterium]|nr:alpha-L-fucosidase [Terriglobia bacterium]